MRFSAIATAFLAPLFVQAFIAFTNNAYTGITTGTPFMFTRSGDNSPVTISLLNGPKQMLVKVSTVASQSSSLLNAISRTAQNQASTFKDAVSGSSFTWTSPTSLTAGTYALSITQSGTTNYSPQFPVASSGVPATISKATSAPATSKDTSRNLAPVTSPASYPAATPPPAVRPPGAPNLTVILDNKPVHSAPDNGSNTAIPAGTASGTSAALPSGTGMGGSNSTLPPFKGGAEKIGQVGWGWSFAAVVVGAVVMRFAF